MQISVKANTYIYLTVLLFLIPVRWIVGWLIAIVFHEFCHWIAVKLCGGNVQSLIISLGGAEMRCSNMTNGCRLLCILCGPVGGMFLILLRSCFPEIALCSFALSIYNLIPLLPLDGGHALRVLIKSQNVFFIMEKFVIMFLSIIALYSSFMLRLGVLPLAVVVGLWIKNRKTPCKENVCKVQ